MIFNTDSTATNWDAVQESKYELGYEGALMHVYENECNYNAIMKAAGISELRYFKETGGDLFVQEASAGTGLIEKFKGFIKAAIEKIKQIFKKIMMFISSKVSDDKTFVKKYKAEVLKNFKKFDFNGYTFPMEVPNYEGVGVMVDIDDLTGFDSRATETTDDYVENKVKSHRATLCGSRGEMDHDEMVEEINNKLYGNDKNKEDIEVTNAVVIAQFALIEDTKNNLKTADNSQKAIIKNLNAQIKSLEKTENEISKSLSKTTDGEDAKANGNRISNINKDMAVCRTTINEITAAYGLHVGAIKDRNRQAKAICVRALNSGSRKSKNESANMFSDIFANVEII